MGADAKCTRVACGANAINYHYARSWEYNIIVIEAEEKLEKAQEQLSSRMSRGLGGVISDLLGESTAATERRRRGSCCPRRGVLSTRAAPLGMWSAHFRQGSGEGSREAAAQERRSRVASRHLIARPTLE